MDVVPMPLFLTWSPLPQPHCQHRYSAWPVAALANSGSTCVPDAREQRPLNSRFRALNLSHWQGSFLVCKGPCLRYL